MLKERHKVAQDLKVKGEKFGLRMKSDDDVRGMNYVIHLPQYGVPTSLARNPAAESEGGQKFFPFNPLPFCPPERSVSVARSAAINQGFVQKRFEWRSVIAIEYN